MRRAVWAAGVALFAALALIACGPRTSDLEAGEKGVVARVFDGDTLELEGGLRVQLTGVIAPARDEPLADDSRAALERFAAGREARLYYGGAKRLDDTLALAQVYVRTEGGAWIWLQESMLRAGMARVRVFRENPARANRLLAIEAKARAAAAGLWANPAFAVHSPDTVRAAAEGYHLVEGAVLSVEPRDDRHYLNFGADYRSDFTIMIPNDALAAWGDPPLDPAALQGVRVRARGYVRERGGPMMAIDHPAQLERLPPG